MRLARIDSKRLFKGLPIVGHGEKGGVMDNVIEALEDLVEFASSISKHDEDYGHLMSDEPDECCICKAYQIIRESKGDELSRVRPIAESMRE